MDRLEELVRDTFAQHAAQAPDPLVLLTGGPKVVVPHNPRRWLALGLAAATVAAVAVGVAALRSGGHDKPPPGKRMPIPANYQTLWYHGIQVSVPETLPVLNQPCPGVVNDVILYSPVPFGCPPDSKKSSAAHLHVWVGPTDPVVKPVGALAVATESTTIDGKPGKTGVAPAHCCVPGGLKFSGYLVLDDPGVIIQVDAPTRDDVQLILHTVRIAPVDRFGCHAHLNSMKPENNAPAAALVTGMPVSAAVCVYPARTEAKYDGWLVGSRAITPGRLALLVANLKALAPPGRAVHDTSTEHDWLILRYADGRTRTLDIARQRPALVTDGQHTLIDTRNTLPRLLE